MANSSIRYYRHAVSLDERRAKFKANLLPRTGGAEESLRMKKHARKKPHKKQSLWELEQQWNDPNAPTDVLEVWFSGKWTDTCECWDLALSDVWFQDAIAVSNDSQDYRHVSSCIISYV